MLAIVDRRVLIFLIFWQLLVGNKAYSEGGTLPLLPHPFVFLRDVDPSILQDIRYATTKNFTSRVVPGYEGGECVVLQKVALALQSAQALLRNKGFTLKVYDCYRPERAVRALVAWAQHPPAQHSTETGPYNPRTPRGRLIPEGYIATSSGHSRGNAVDVTLVALSSAIEQADGGGGSYEPCTAPKARREPDNSVDMGTAFDCFDVLSNAGNTLITPEQKRFRWTLASAMESAGFRRYSKEWWHFSFMSPASGSFDFPIPKRNDAACLSTFRERRTQCGNGD